MEDEQLQRAVEQLEEELAILAAGDGPNYTISKVNSGFQVGGRVKEMNVDLFDENKQVKKCIVKIAWVLEHRDHVSVVIFDCEGEERVERRRIVVHGN